MLIDVQKVSALGAKQQVFLLLPDFNDSEDADVDVDAIALHKHFEPEYLHANKKVERTAMGRGPVYFFQFDDTLSVLRHYYRGGFIAKFVKDRFVFAGIENSRPYQELKLLTYLYNAGVSVPKPVAARVTLLGMTYQADIMTQAIEQSEELHQMLLSQPVPIDVWQAIACEVAKMHAKDACHSDLNVKNVLVKPDQSIVLLDFDACTIKRSGNWREANIARFKRSLQKQQNKHDNYHFDDQQWDAFINAYTEQTSYLISLSSDK